MKFSRTIFCLSFFLSLFVVEYSYAQAQHRFGFAWNRNYTATDSLGNTLKFPWAGGINAMHFSEIDLNGDGIMDLIGFDQHGQQLLPFLNHGTSNNIDYTYAPEYLGRFPAMQNWMRTYDYNGDGKMDLFTFHDGGIKAFKNISTSGSVLEFLLVSENLQADYGGGNPLDIFISSVDYPGLADIDFDGDMDILNFYLIGGFVYYYKNVSVESYGNADHLVFKLASECWGEFIEAEDNNEVVLDTQCYSKQGYLPALAKPNIKHTGSTFCLLDINNDSLMDLLLGDVDYFGINLLSNGGTRDTAKITSQEINFPASDQAVELVSFPCADYIDVDNDGKRELIIGSFEAAYYKTSAVNSVHLYENTGSNQVPDFSLDRKHFIQEDMIDAGDNAAPAIVDVNGDGMLDLVIGNYGRVKNAEMDSITYILTIDKHAQLSYYQNTGSSTQPAFELKTMNWIQIDTMMMTAVRPTFGDMDGDGDKDMLCGSSEGTLTYFENLAGSGQNMYFAAPVRNYKGIDIVEFSSPQLFDLDGDQLLDILVGREDGRLSYYRNTGTATIPDFTLQTHQLGNVDVRTYLHSNSAYSAPYFYRDEQNRTKLFVGSASGLTFFYDRIDNNLNGSFGQDSSIYLHEYNNIGDQVKTLYSLLQYENHGQIQELSKEGLRSVPAIADLNSDGHPDMILGNFRGGLRFFDGTSYPYVGIKLHDQVITDLRISPNPASEVARVRWTSSNSQTFSLHVFDMTGRKVFSMENVMQNEAEINTAELPNGIYMVQLLSSSNAPLGKALKLIVKH